MPSSERLFDPEDYSQKRKKTPVRHVVEGEAAPIMSAVNKINIPLSAGQIKSLEHSLQWIYARPRSIPSPESPSALERLQSAPYIPLRVDEMSRLMGYFCVRNSDGRFDPNLERAIACIRVVPDSGGHYYVLEEFWKKFKMPKRRTVANRAMIHEPLRIVYGFYPEFSFMESVQIAINCSQGREVEGEAEHIPEVNGYEALRIAVELLKGAKARANQFKPGMRGGVYFLHPYFVDPHKPHPHARIPTK